MFLFLGWQVLKDFWLGVLRQRILRNTSLLHGKKWKGEPGQKLMTCSEGVGGGGELFKAGPLDLSFWSFLTFLHHSIEEVERHLL